jgi:hypothetical protein
MELTYVLDIIEGVNLNTVNSMTLHSSPNCTIAGTGMLGTLQGSNCAYYPGYDVGCGITANTNLSYGAGFNANGGGMFSLLLHVGLANISQAYTQWNGLPPTSKSGSSPEVQSLRVSTLHRQIPRPSASHRHSLKGAA